MEGFRKSTGQPSRATRARLKAKNIINSRETVSAHGDARPGWLNGKIRLSPFILLPPTIRVVWEGARPPFRKTWRFLYQSVHRSEHQIKSDLAVKLSFLLQDNGLPKGLKSKEPRRLRRGTPWARRSRMPDSRAPRQGPEARKPHCTQSSTEAL